MLWYFIYLYCKRIMLAILSLKNSLVVWPTGESRKIVHSGFKNIGGFENVIGAIDGTHIILGIAPLKQPEIYWNRKKKYSIQCQGIVNHMIYGEFRMSPLITHLMHYIF